MIALLEVMDKEWDLPSIWVVFLGFGLLGFVFGLRRSWATIPVVLLLALATFVQLSELHDDSVGPDILAEAGRGYFVQSYAAMISGFVLILAGIFLGRNRRKTL
jgi:hypothetical protein